MRWRLIMAVLPVAGLLLAGCGGSSNKPAATPTPPPVNQGATPSSSPAPTPTAGTFGQPVNVTEEGNASASITVRPPTMSQSDGTSVTATNGAYVTFVVHIVNTGNQPFTYGGGSFGLQDSDGRMHDQDGSASDPLEPNQALNPGGQITGNVTFDAPTHGTLIYTPNGSAVDTAEWKY